MLLHDGAGVTDVLHGRPVGRGIELFHVQATPSTGVSASASWIPTFTPCSRRAEDITTTLSGDCSWRYGGFPGRNGRRARRRRYSGKGGGGGNGQDEMTQ